MDVLDILQSLVDKSIAVYEPGPDGAGRYGLPESLREYAAERLRSADDSESLRENHFRYYLDLSERTEEHLHGPDAPDALNLLESEQANFRTALGWACEEDDRIRLELRLAAALSYFWMIRGHFAEGQGYLATILNRTGREAGTLRARALFGFGSIALFEHGSGVERAETCFNEALTIYRTCGNKRGIAQTTRMLGEVAWRKHDLAEAQWFLNESMGLSITLGDRSCTASALYNLGVVAGMQGDFESARRLWQDSLAIYRDLGDAGGMSGALMGVAGCAFESQNYAEARASYEESLSLRRQLGHKVGMIATLNHLAMTVSQQGDLHSARSLYIESLGIAMQLGDNRYATHALIGVAATLGTVKKAAMLIGAADAWLGGAEKGLSTDEYGSFQREAAQLRASLGDETFVKAWTGGRAMSLNEAITLALE